MPFFLVLALALALVLPGAALATGVSAQQTFNIINNRTGGPPQPQLGVDSAGNATVAGAVDKLPYFIQATQRPLGSGWGGTDELGTVPATGGAPSLSVDAAGNALLAWVDSSTTAPCTGVASGCLRVVSKRADSSTWTNEKAYASTTALLDPATALDGNGNGAVIWRTLNAGQYQVFGARGALGGSWSSAQTLISALNELPSFLRLAYDGSGRPVAMWGTQVPTPACPCNVRISVNFAAATIMTGPSTGAYQGLSLQRNQQGAVDAMWVTSDPTATTRTLNTSALTPPATTFGSPQTAYSTTTSHQIVGPEIVTAADGEASALWTDIVSGITVIRGVMYATRAAGASTWAPAVALDGNTVEPGGPALAIDGSGNATAVWHNAGTGLMRYATRAHGGSFSGATDGPAATAPPVAAADTAGNVHVAWAENTSAIGTFVVDNAGPALAFGGTNATTGIVRVAIPMAVTSSDPWSSPVSVQWDFGDGQTGTGDSTSHAYAAPGQYTARATATDAAGNTSSQTQTVTVSAVPGLPRPIAGRSINLEPVSGTVLVKVPGTNVFVPLVTPTQVQPGSIIDARKGRVRITIDNGIGGLDTAEFYGGIFRFDQPKVKAGQRWFANLYLFGGSFKGCPAAPKNPTIAVSTRTKKTIGKKGEPSPKRTVRELWGSGEGAFRTVGRFSSATIRGTTWLTRDRCDATLTKVTVGKVGVRDFVLRKTVLVRAPKSYLAKPRAKRSTRTAKRKKR